MAIVVSALLICFTMIDKKLTEDMQAWLNAEKHDRESVARGAEMVLKLTRNMSMYQTIMRRPERFESKVRYELQKFLPMRLENMTTQDVKLLDAELTPQIAAAIEEQAKFEAEHKAEKNNDTEVPEGGYLPAASGIRPDHDNLPEDVRNIWAENKERWLKIKKLYNTLLTFEQPCDRYEYLKQLKDLWYTYKSELGRYDGYVAPSDDAQTEGEEPTPADIAKNIANARSYITKNVDRLAELRRLSRESDDATKELDEYNKLLAKVQARVAVLNDNNAPIGDDLKTKLNEAGLSLPSAE